MKARKRKKKMLWLLWVPAVLAVLFWWYQTKGNKENMTEATFWEGPSSCSVGDLNYLLPEGCTQEQHPDGIRFSVEGVEVGGIDSYSVPENPDWNYGHWVEQLGLREFGDETLGFSGSSSVYAMWEMEFFTDLPGGQPPAVQRYHYFFLSEDMTMAYDLWFDLLTVDRTLMDTIVHSCSVGNRGHNPVETTQTTEAQEETPDPAVLEKCKAVLEQVQSGSRYLRCERSSAYDDGVIEYWLHEGDWMTIQHHSGDNMIAFLYKNGTYYDNGEMVGNIIGARDAEGNVIWKESDGSQSSHIPWLSRYQWNDETVMYLGMEQYGEETHIRLCVKEPFPGFEFGNPEYDVTMVFAADDSFLRAELSVNEGHASQSAFTEKEKILSLDSQTVSAQIEEEYRKAVS